MTSTAGRRRAWIQNADQLAQPATAHLVVITGPIASVKSTTAGALAAVANGHGLTAVVVGVHDVAQVVAAPGAGAPGAMAVCHQAHGALVARWLRTRIDLVIAVGPIYSDAERATLVDQLPAGTLPPWVVLDVPAATTWASAAADLTAVCPVKRPSTYERHDRFRRQLTDIPAVQSFDTQVTNARTHRAGGPSRRERFNLLSAHNRRARPR